MTCGRDGEANVQLHACFLSGSHGTRISLSVKLHGLFTQSSTYVCVIVGAQKGVLLPVLGFTLFIFGASREMHRGKVTPTFLLPDLLAIIFFQDFPTLQG